MNENIGSSRMFDPPEGILDGSEREIALNFLARRQRDRKFRDRTRVACDPDHAVRMYKTNQAVKKVLSSLERRVRGGDDHLAGTLTHWAEDEVDSLNRGLSCTVSGQAHLMVERMNELTGMYGIEIDDPAAS